MEMGPSQQRGRDVIALGSLFSALAMLNSGGLFPLAMKLLDLPAYRCLLADCGGGSFRKIVGDDPFRVSGRGNQPEQFDLMTLGKFLEVNEFAVQHKNPHQGSSLAWAAWIIARLGGRMGMPGAQGWAEQDVTWLATL